jgi:hypothetical protein
VSKEADSITAYLLLECDVNLFLCRDAKEAFEYLSTTTRAVFDSATQTAVHDLDVIKKLYLN